MIPSRMSLTKRTYIQEELKMTSWICLKNELVNEIDRLGFLINEQYVDDNCYTMECVKDEGRHAMDLVGESYLHEIDGVSIRYWRMSSERADMRQTVVRAFVKEVSDTDRDISEYLAKRTTIQVCDIYKAKFELKWKDEWKNEMGTKEFFRSFYG